MPSGTRLVTLLLVLAGAVGTVRGQATYGLATDTDEVFVGESFPVRLMIRNARSYSEPTLPSLPDCTIQVGGQRKFSQFINGRSSEQLTLTYHITPRRPGQLRIPPVELEIDGEQVRTNGLTVRVRPAREREVEAVDADGNRLLTAEVLTEAEHLYVGQEARFTLRVLVRKPSGLGRTLTANDMYSLLSNTRTGFGAFPKPEDAQARETQLRLRDGTQGEFYEFDLNSNVVLDRTGPVQFEGLVLEMDYPLELSRDIFGRVRVERSRSLAIRPRMLVPDVLPLPDEGVPPGFAGAVGQFKLNVTADRTAVRVGDPIELRLVVTGDGPLETLARPRLSEQEALTRDFRVQEESLAGDTIRNRRMFSQTIRARRSAIREIPAIEMPYFNPETRQYEIARSRPIPLEVQATETVNAAELLDLETAEEGRGEVSAVDGLRGNVTAAGRLLERRRPVAWREVALVTAVPPLAFGGFWLLTLVRSAQQGDPRARRRRAALRTAEQRLSSAGSVAAYGPILANYVADRTGAPEGSLTGADALARLRARGASDALCDRFERIVEDAEAAAYGAVQTSDHADEDARLCLREMEAVAW